jgi:hypothetical protein
MCQKRRRKCTGTVPCALCHRLGAECVYDNPPDRPLPGDGDGSGDGQSPAHLLSGLSVLTAAALESAPPHLADAMGPLARLPLSRTAAGGGAVGSFGAVVPPPAALASMFGLHPVSDGAAHPAGGHGGRSAGAGVPPPTVEPQPAWGAGSMPGGPATACHGGTAIPWIPAGVEITPSLRSLHAFDPPFFAATTSEYQLLLCFYR